MTQKQFTEKLLKKYGIEYTCFDDRGNGCYRGEYNGKGWRLYDTCSWDGYYQLTHAGGYCANRIKVQTAIKKILAL